MGLYLLSLLIVRVLLSVFITIVFILLILRIKESIREGILSGDEERLLFILAVMLFTIVFFVLGLLF